MKIKFKKIKNKFGFDNIIYPCEKKVNFSMTKNII